MEVIILTIQNKFDYRVLRFIFAGEKFYDEDNIAVTWCLLRDAMNIGKVPKAFSYSFNVFRLSHSSVEGGTGRSLIKLLQLNRLNESTFCMNFYCVKFSFLFGKTIFDKILKLVEGAIKPLHVRKHLKF